MVENRFNEGFPPDGVDGRTFGDLLHHIHPNFHQNDTVVDPSDHGIFMAEKLASAWKDLIRGYDTVMVNFTKSSNHDSSFTRASMVTQRRMSGESTSITSEDEELDDGAGNDDEFGVETGGWCCFTNSLPIIYLRMWLNDKPQITSFVSRQILPDVQLDTGNKESSKRKQKSIDNVSSAQRERRLPTDTIVDAIIGLVEAREAATAHQTASMSKVLGQELKSFLSSPRLKEKI
jgi:hypothetical protein